MQGIDELKDHYKESAATILSNCAFNWFSNVNDLDRCQVPPRDTLKGDRRDHREIGTHQRESGLRQIGLKHDLGGARRALLAAAKGARSDRLYFTPNAVQKARRACGRQGEPMPGRIRARLNVRDR